MLFPIIDRFPDGAAMITIMEEGTRKIVAQYESVSKGATKSARKEIARLVAQAKEA